MEFVLGSRLDYKAKQTLFVAPLRFTMASYGAAIAHE